MPRSRCSAASARLTGRVGAPLLVLGLIGSAQGFAAPARRAVPPTELPVQNAIPASSPLARKVSLQVRAAALGEVIASLAKATDVRLAVDPSLAGRRITLNATDTNVGGVQQALAALYRSSWGRDGTSLSIRYTLLRDSELQEAGARLRQERNGLFLDRLRGTAAALQRKPEAVVAGLRADLVRRYPDLPASAREAVTAPLLNRALLALPLDPTRRAELVDMGGTLAFLRALPPGSQQLLTSFYSSAGGELEPDETQASAEATQALLTHPRARAEWRFLYGDVWTDTLFLARVGAGDSWATGSLPGALFNLPDYASLFPGTAAPVRTRELSEKVAVRIDTARLTWDQALALLARAAKLNVLSDSYPRPAFARPEGMSTMIDAPTVGGALDQLARRYGYAWWQVGDWILFRHRYWYEEERASLSDSTLRGLGEVLTGGKGVPQDVLAYLAQLDEQQLLTLNMMAAAGGGPTAPADAFEYNRAQTLRQGLRLFETFNDDQRAASQAEGLPFWQLNPAQQSVALAFAYDRGVPVDPESRQTWRFQLTSDIKAERSGATSLASGSLNLLFDFGEGGTRRMTLRLRIPKGRAEGSVPASPPAAGQPAPATPEPAASGALTLPLKPKAQPVQPGGRSPASN